jgi:hypothetical protein
MEKKNGRGRTSPRDFSRAQRARMIGHAWKEMTEESYYGVAAQSWPRHKWWRCSASGAQIARGLMGFLASARAARSLQNRAASFFFERRQYV